MKPVQAKAPLESFAIDTFGEPIRTPRGDGYILAVTDRLSNFFKAIPM